MPWRIDFPGSKYLFWKEVAVRIVIITLFAFTEELEPFWRTIQPEEVWLYKYPTTEGYVSTASLYAVAVIASLATVSIFYFLNQDFRDAWEGFLVPSLAIPLSGLITNTIKLSVGRPRPDYFARCYPGMKDFDISLPCTGDPQKIIEGRKSFPSGHASSSFCTMIFVSLYIAGKLGTFHARGRRQAWRLIIVLIPPMCSLLVAISRTCDYHHHWQDVTVGGIIGIVTCYVVYRHYYPSISHPSSHMPLILLAEYENQKCVITPVQNRRPPMSQASSSITLVKNV